MITVNSNTKERYSKTIQKFLNDNHRENWLNLYYHFSALDYQNPVLTPADLYQELFHAVQLARVFPDGKTFADCTAKMAPELILEQYRARSSLPDFNLALFVHEHFYTPYVNESNYVSDSPKSLQKHIEDLWPILTKVSVKNEYSSLLDLPYPYIVPGGRFGETFYWDSYFAMLGFVDSGRPDLLKDMTDNFAWLIDQYGHIPNGNRTYFLSRSHPPVFSLMLELIEEKGLANADDYIEQLLREYSFWMEGSNKIVPGQALRHVVALDDGSILNRYWDERDSPRDESWAEDIETANLSGREHREVYRELRSAAASGWDFSSRWLDETNLLSSIRTTAFIPIDLNAFLFNLERKISEILLRTGKTNQSKEFRSIYLRRKKAINKHLWDSASGVYRDYDWENKCFGAFSAASLTPFFVKMSSAKKAHSSAQAVRNTLLTPGGILSTVLDTGEQWDKPNAWAPLQWMAVIGFENYGEKELAQEIATNWIHTVDQFYQKHHKLVEKYDITNKESLPGGGGEYPLQDGFAWTNGVTYQLLMRYSN